MNYKYFTFIAILFFTICLVNQDNLQGQSLYSTSKPYTRWWWFASEIQNEGIAHQLDWVKENNFGGVEISFIYPYNRDSNAIRYKWLGKEWSVAVAYAKHYADSIGLGCDFTFGNGWPFGDSYVPLEDAVQQYGATDDSYKRSWNFWEYPHNGYHLNHLDSQALYRYSSRMGNALADALTGSTSSLFCDSWEVPSYKMWTYGFDSVFYKTYHYDITPYMDSLYNESNAEVRYDYTKLISNYILTNFYAPFTHICHKMNALSRVQCMGAPVDILSAYSQVDIPETEAMLYNPEYSRIVSSAATLSSKKDVSSETFTCVYGFPKKHHLHEQTADLKLVADALFAKGVNQIYWHGMPFNPIACDTQKFYATVHVGAIGNLSNELPAFNTYMETVCNIMKQGVSYSDVCVYLPIEDAWIAGEYPEKMKKPGSDWYYDLQHVQTPQELIAYHPLWINGSFLGKGKLIRNKLYCGDAVFSSLYIDAEHLDYEVLQTVFQLASNGFPICVKQQPKEPSKNKTDNYEILYTKLMQLKNVSSDFTSIHPTQAFIVGDSLPEYWCKKQDDHYYIFFANPLAKNLTYPITYGQSYTEEAISMPLTINADKTSFQVNLNFKPYQSLLLHIYKKSYEWIPIEFIPVTPVKKE